MSSFNTYDNYNSFNDLINRTEVLEEKDFKSMVGSAKLRPEFAKYKAEDPKTGEKASPGGLSRLANILFVTALGEAHLDILDQETTNTLKGAKYSTSSTRIGQGLQELAPKAFKELFREKNPRSVEVSEYVNDPEKLEELIKDTVINYTRRDREYIKDIETEDIADAVEDAVDDISAEVRLAKGLMDGEAEKVELDFDEADIFIDGIDDGVKSAVSQKAADYLNKQGEKAGLKAEVTRAGVNIEAPTGFFGDAARMAQFEDKLKGLVMDLDGNIPEERIRVKFTGSDGPVEYKDEDYEEGPEPIEPTGTDSEYEEDINEVEDEESNIKFSVGSVGGQHGQIMTKDKTFDSLEDACDHAGVDVKDCISGEWDDMGDGTKEYVVDEDTVIIMHAASEDNEFDDFDIGPQSDENVPDDYEEVLAALVDDDKKKHAMKQLNGEDEEELQVESTTAAYLTEQKDRDNRFKVNVVEEGIGNLAAAAGRGLVKAAKSKTAKKVARGIGNFAKDAAIETGRVAAELGGEGLKVAGKAVMKGADKLIDAADEGINRLASDEEVKVGSMVTTNYGEVVHIDEIDTDSDMKGRPVYMGTDKDGGEHILYSDQIHAVSPEGEEDEECIVMQPMLESHKTDTSAYLTEQSASDKRNKKTEVKNQSFKEKYKPKTQWQLEELRRYGL